jgi:hypothetical protein
VHIPSLIMVLNLAFVTSQFEKHLGMLYSICIVLVRKCMLF